MSQFKVGDVVKFARKIYPTVDAVIGDTFVVTSVVSSRSVTLKPHNITGYTNICHGSYTIDQFDLVSSVSTTKTFSELKEWKQEALRMHYNGESHGAIAEALGKPYFTVTTHLRRYKPRYPKEVVEQYYQKPTPTELAEASGGTYQSPDTYYKTQQRTKPTIFVIGDTQVKAGISLDYIRWVGNYIAAKQPEIIVMIGDWYDMEALSSYDKGMLSAEGRRVKADIDAGDAALEILESYIASVKDYNPRKVVTLGNHEERIDRFVNSHPEFDGYIGTDKLAFHRLGWEVYPFLTPAAIEGIHFVHYVQNVMTGKPLGGSVASMLSKVGESFVMGHKQVLEHTLRYLPMSGRAQIGIIIGACYAHDESYKGVQGNHHFRGCVMLYECHDGSAMSKPVSLDHMRELYEESL